MTPQAQKIFDEAMHLPPAERISLADQLYASMENEIEQNVLGEEWLAEIQQRIADIESGKVKTIPHAEAMRMMFELADE